MRDRERQRESKIGRQRDRVRDTETRETSHSSSLSLLHYVARQPGSVTDYETATELTTPTDLEASAYETEDTAR